MPGVGLFVFKHQPLYLWGYMDIETQLKVILKVKDTLGPKVRLMAEDLASKSDISDHILYAAMMACVCTLVQTGDLILVKKDDTDDTNPS
jgi:hypothetical protein